MQRNEVRRLRSYVAAGGKRMLCIYEAPDSATVQQVQREIGFAFEEAWPALVWLWSNAAY